jgi:hypothetical protein
MDTDRPKLQHVLLLTTLVAVVSASLLTAGSPPPSPEEYLGRPVGEDRFLAPWPQVVAYMNMLGESSDRVKVESAGETTLGNDMPVVVISSPANLKRLDRYREMTRQLANPDTISEKQAERLIAEGRVIVLLTCSIHSTEVGSTQMSMELAHELATSDDQQVLGWLDQVILLLMPSINPDGQVMVVDWYNRYLGTEHEGGRMPWLYHHYVGHDNNRDFYMLTQKETRVVNELLYHRWFPQIYLDEHQMGSTGPRMFVPPQTDPLAPEIHSLMFRQADLLGTTMAMRLEEGGKTGVGSNMIFDSYWPGGTRNTAWWKNVTGLLTEVASVRRGTPIYVDPSELRGGGKGLPQYNRRANFPSPWPGGWWRLRDIIDYELIASRSVLDTAARYRQQFLRNFYTVASDAVAKGRATAPYAFLIPPDQHDPTAAGLLVELLLRHGIRVEVAEAPFTVGRSLYAAGTHVVTAAQPYRAFLLTMLRPQRYPEVIAYSGGPVIRPYDSTSWSLPIGMGVEVREAEQPVEAKLRAISEPVWPQVNVASRAVGHMVPHSADTAPVLVNRLHAAGKQVRWLAADDDGFAAGDIYLPVAEVTAKQLQSLTEELHLPVTPVAKPPKVKLLQVNPVRTGLYKPWSASMDEGWTRFVLEQYEMPLESLHNETMIDGEYRERVDVVLFPDVEPAIIATGKPDSQRSLRWWSPLPPEYSGGIGEEGGKLLAEWIREGGTAVALNRSTGYLIKLLELPVTDVVAKQSRESFDCPGTMLRLQVDTSHPLGFGLRAEEAGYFDSSPAFATRVPDGRYQRHVVARFPEHRQDILVSGYLVGADKLTRRAAVVELKIGKGRVVLIGFKPQNRAQTHRTFKLLLNALFLSGLQEITE